MSSTFMYTKFLAAALLLTVGCNVFTTRDPESPNSGRSSFLPPTSAQIVVANFKSAIVEKNTENFIQCFADTAKGATLPFVYEPSASVSAQYPSLFQLWNIGSERQSFQSMMNKLPTDILPILQLTNDRYDVTTPDSSVYEAEYLLSVPHSVQTIPTQARGYLRLTIRVQNGGLWSIHRWSDSSPIRPDSVGNTWTLLKAKFSN